MKTIIKLLFSRLLKSIFVSIIKGFSLLFSLIIDTKMLFKGRLIKITSTNPNVRREVKVTVVDPHIRRVITSVVTGYTIQGLKGLDYLFSDPAVIVPTYQVNVLNYDEDNESGKFEFSFNVTRDAWYCIGERDKKKINRRPRQKLNFETPKSEFYKRIISVLKAFSLGIGVLSHGAD